MQNITNKEVIKISKLNQQLVKIEQMIDNLLQKEYRQILKKLAKKTNKMDDWELEVEIDFYNNEKVVHTVYERYTRNTRKKKYTRNFINDGANHNVANRYGNKKLTKQHHCWLLHSLYDDSHLTWKKIFHIDSILFDIKPIFQYEVKLNNITNNLDLNRMNYLLNNKIDNEQNIKYKNCSIEFNGSSEDMDKKLNTIKPHLLNAKEVYIKLIINKNITMCAVSNIIEEINNSIGENTNIKFITDINNSIDIDKYEYQIIITGLEKI